MKSFSKKLQLNIAIILVFVIFRLFHLTFRTRFINAGLRMQAQKLHSRGGCIIPIWHEHAFGSIGTHAFQNVSPLISLSDDGALVAFLCKQIGMEPIRGSSSRRGSEAKSEAVEAVQRGQICAITVDGPRGPRRQPKKGLFLIAKESGGAIIPCITVANRYWRLKSWDRLVIPKPFARLTVIYGDAMQVNRDFVLDEQSIQELSDRFVGEMDRIEAMAEAFLKGEWDGASQDPMNVPIKHKQIKQLIASL